MNTLIVWLIKQLSVLSNWCCMPWPFRTRPRLKHRFKEDCRDIRVIVESVTTIFKVFMSHSATPILLSHWHFFNVRFKNIEIITLSRFHKFTCIKPIHYCYQCIITHLHWLYVFVCLSGSVSCIVFLYEILIYDVMKHFAVLCGLLALYTSVSLSLIKYISVAVCCGITMASGR